MVALEGVVLKCMWTRYWYVGEVLVADHAGGETVTELLDLFLYVPAEGIARPPPYQYDSIDRYLIEVHGHGGA